MGGAGDSYSEVIGPWQGSSQGEKDVDPHLTTNKQNHVGCGGLLIIPALGRLHSYPGLLGQLSANERPHSKINENKGE